MPQVENLIYSHFLQYVISYGYEFLFETYLYHVTRKDHRHNFSFWFYNIYLTFTSRTGTLVGVLTFVPQLALVLAIGCCFGKDIFLCAFLQTFAFVAWNKVCTAQVRIICIDLCHSLHSFVSILSRTFTLLHNKMRSNKIEAN